MSDDTIGSLGPGICTRPSAAYIRTVLLRKGEPHGMTPLTPAAGERGAGGPLPPAQTGEFGQRGNSTCTEKARKSGTLSLNLASFLSSHVLPSVIFRQTALV